MRDEFFVTRSTWSGKPQQAVPQKTNLHQQPTQHHKYEAKEREEENQQPRQITKRDKGLHERKLAIKFKTI